jgi:hypothetical protein
MKNIDDINGDNSYFIHFNSIKECNSFKQNFNGTIGNMCCNGKGVHVKTYKGKTIDNEQIYDIIRKEYKSN